MSKRIEKHTFRIPPCKICKEMLNPLVNLLKGLRVQCTLHSRMVDIETDDIDLFLKSDWPLSISLVEIKTLDVDQNINIIMDFENKKGHESKVSVHGTSATWVHGMGSQLEDIFKKSRQRYYPITNYWQIRSLVSLAVIFFLGWTFSHYLWKMELSQPPIGITELQLMAILFSLLTWFLYPLDKALLWLFPHLEFANSPQEKIRKVFWSLLVILIVWILTEHIFPTLIP